VTKFGVIISICILTASGCALIDEPEVTPEASVMTLPVMESERVAPISEVEDSKAQSIKEPIRTASMEDIRRLQMHLHELGFDPGPADGIAGAKTKAAFQRLHSSCRNLEPLSEKLPIAAQQNISSFNRAETIKLQSQLRAAGFSPGPVDGIFGNKTKSVLFQVQSGCLMVKDLNGRLELASGPTKKQLPFATPADVLKSPADQQPSMALTRTEAQKSVVGTQPVRSQEEIRILQLRLRDAGFDPGPFDGVMGQKTRSALQQYEESQRNKKVKTSLTTNVSGHY
jgi:peptidoglycan hydrolase-like protein with peptidoglycan-binding domain